MSFVSRSPVGPSTCNDQQALCEAPSTLPKLLAQLHTLCFLISILGLLVGPCLWLESLCLCSLLLYNWNSSNIPTQRGIPTLPSTSYPFTPACGEPMTTKTCCYSVLHQSLPVDVVGSMSMHPMLLTSVLGTRAGGYRDSFLCPFSAIIFPGCHPQRKMEGSGTSLSTVSSPFVPAEYHSTFPGDG